MEINHHASFTQNGTRLSIKDRTASSAEHDPFTAAKLVYNCRLAVAKRELPFDFKDRRNADTRTLFKFVIGVNEWQLQAFSQELAYGGLARPHKTYQEYVANLHDRARYAHALTHYRQRAC